MGKLRTLNSIKKVTVIRRRINKPIVCYCHIDVLIIYLYKINFIKGLKTVNKDFSDTLSEINLYDSTNKRS